MIKIFEIKEGNIQVEPSIKKMKARVLLINSSNEILIANYGGVFLLPGGSIEKGEDPNLAIVREIKEETGIDVKIEDLQPFLKMRYYQIDYPERNGKKSDRLLIAYYYLGNVESFSMENKHLSEKEKKDGFELKFYSLDEIERLIKTNDSNNPRKPYFDKELTTVLDEYKKMEKSKELKEKRIAYINYIREHKANIIIAYKKFKNFMSRPDINIILSNEELKCLENAVMKHDDSKISKIEFEAFRKHFFPCSFEKEDEEDKENFKKAKWHHYQSEDHHPQNKSRKVGLNKVACIHNILDWIAMSYKFDDKVWEYYNSSSLKDILNPLEREYIEQVLDIIRLNELYFYGEAKSEPDEDEER